MYAFLTSEEFLNEPNQGPIVEGLEVQKQRILETVLRRVPELEHYTFDYADLARHAKVSEDEARRRWRHLELWNEEFGLDVDIYDEIITMAVDRAFKGEKEQQAMNALWEICRIARREWRLQAYDPQLERLVDVDLAADREAMLTDYRRIGISRYFTAKPGKPRWKFW